MQKSSDDNVEHSVAFLWRILPCLIKECMIENREREKGGERKGEREREREKDGLIMLHIGRKGYPSPFFYLTVGLHFYVDILYMTIF